MEQWCQSPLNLVKKTKPVAIVAPSSKISESKSEDDSEEKSEIREEEEEEEEEEAVEDVVRSKSSNSARYHIDKLLEKDDNNDRTTTTGCSNNLYSMISDLSSTEQQVLAAIYMRDLVTNFQNPYMRFSSYGSYPMPFLGAYENYKRLVAETAEKNPGEDEDQKTPKDDPYPFLRERLNARPVFSEEEKKQEKEGEDEEDGESEERINEKPDYETGIDFSVVRAGAKPEVEDSEEPLNLRVASEEPLDFSKKSSSFPLNSNQPVSLTLNLKSPEFESLSKPLVLTIPNPQERTSKQKKDRIAKYKR